MLTNIKIYSKIILEVNNIAEWSSLVARRAHNPKVGGSNPPSATKKRLLEESSGFFILKNKKIKEKFYEYNSCGFRK